MAERFSQKNLRVRPSSDEEKIVTNAKKHFEKTLVEISGEQVGSVAALEHPTKNTKLNYGEIFLRDNVPVMIYLITQNRYEIVKKFLSVCLELQSTNYQTRGVFPTSFVEEKGKLIGDYGQRSIGRITSADAVYGGPFYVGIMSIKAVIKPLEKVKAFKEVFNFY